MAGHAITDAFAVHGTGFARNNRFNVLMTLPTTLRVSQQLGDKLMWSCKAASAPASTLGTVIAFTQGSRELKFPGDRTYEDWNVTIYNDSEHDMHNLFYEWSNSMNGNISNVTSAQYTTLTDMMGNADIIQADPYGNETGASIIRMNAMWPVRVGEIQLDWEQSNQVETFEVQFAYHWFEIEGVTS